MTRQTQAVWPWLLLAVLPWLGALRGPFQFDDLNVIVHYAPVHSPGGWLAALPGIRPLLKLSYALNWTLSPAPWGFHVVNLLIHGLNAALLWRWLRGGLLPDARAAAFAVALWLLHPLQSEAVTYICGRSVSLSATFMLLALLAARQPGRKRFALVFLATLAALAVRETSWILPGLILLARRLEGLTPRAALTAAAPSALAVMPAALVFLVEPHYRHLIDAGLAARPMADQGLTVLAAWRYFLTGPLVTLTPNIDPTIPAAKAWGLPEYAQASALIIMTSIATQRVWRYGDMVWGGVLWFFLCVLPVNGFLPRLDVANDRHLYLALAAPAWMLAALLSRYRAGQIGLTVLAAVLAVSLMIRNEDYASAVALWNRTAQQSPDSSRVWNNLGVACRDAGQADCALAAFREAWRLDPGNLRAGVNLYFQEAAQKTPNDGKSPPSLR